MTKHALYCRNRFLQLYTKKSLFLDSSLLDEVEDESKDDNQYTLESENMEEHKSLILHLLSKLKLGMDLTKVSNDYLNCSLFIILKINVNVEIFAFVCEAL